MVRFYARCHRLQGWKISGPREIKDPDLGTIRLAAPPKRDESESLIREQEEALAKRRIWSEGSVSKCPSCGRRAFVGRSDLNHEIARPGGVVIYRHLRGARCAHCDAQTLEPGEQIQVEREVGTGRVADYETKVSRIGSGTVGTYWPKDVVRVMNLNPETRAFIQVLDRDTALIRFVKGSSARKRGKRTPPRRPVKKATKRSNRAHSSGAWPRLGLVFNGGPV